MKLSTELRDFQTRLGHQFTRPDLLVRALTHSSIASDTRPSNERLEFLGDRVLGLTMAEALFRADRSAAEGKLAPRFNALVRQEACAAVARQIGLGDVLKLGRSEMMSGGRRKDALLADAMEAVIAAVYLDAGFEAARALVLALWGKRVDEAETRARDAKSALQEWAQARSLSLPDYTVIERTGAAHEPMFTIEVRLDNGATARARAGSKRAAEQAAAKTLLEQLENEDD